MYRIPAGWTAQQYRDYLINKARKDRAAREKEIADVQKQQKEAAKSAQNNQLVQTGAALGGKYLFDKGLAGITKDLGSASDTIGSWFSAEAGKEVAKEAAKEVGTQVATEYAKSLAPQAGQSLVEGAGLYTPVGDTLSQSGTSWLGNQFGQGLGLNLGTALGVAGAAYGGHKLIDSIDSKGGRKNAAMSGAMMGAAIGSMIPGIGTALGMAVGALVGGAGGAAMGNLRSGKSQEQQFRDDQRKAFLHSMGREKQAGDFTVGLDGGAKYDFGLDGGADYTGAQGNKLKAYDLDLNNPLAGAASKYVGVIGGLAGITGGQLESQLARGLLTGATDENGVKANARAILAQQGVTSRDQAVQKLQQLYPGAPMSQTMAAVDELFKDAPVTASQTQPPQPPPQPQQAPTQPQQQPPAQPITKSQYNLGGEGDGSQCIGSHQSR